MRRQDRDPERSSYGNKKDLSEMQETVLQG